MVRSFSNTNTDKILFVRKHINELINLSNLTNFKRKFAFTLAEVLITLGIIGVVAALTIPTLMRNYEKKVTEAKVKQSFSMLAQAIKMSVAENGDMTDWDNFSGATIEEQELFMNKYMLPYLKTLHYCDKKGTGQNIVLPCKGGAVSPISVEYILSNGVTASFKPVRGYIAVLINVNVSNKPSQRMGRDRFYFSIINNNVIPSGYLQGVTREQIFEGYEISGHVYACKDKKPANTGDNYNYRHACTVLFYIDGMKFSPDYPW